MVATDTLDTFLAEVPENLQPRFREIVRIVDRFCHERLDGEYREICRRMLACYCQPETGIERGKAESWAAGIVYEVGQVNFLTDPSFDPCVKSEVIAKECGVSVGTMHNKGKCIREALRLSQLDLEFNVANRLRDHPLAWIMELPNGMVVDLRNLPEEARQQLSIAGLLPDESAEPQVRDWRERIVGRRPATSSGTFYTLKISLQGSEPLIWRRVQLPDCLLAELHEVIQVAMGWENCHLHEFVVGKERFQPPPPDDLAPMWEMGDCESTEEVALSDIVPAKKRKPLRFSYVYDFGDGWEHSIVVEKVEQLDEGVLVPVCLVGERACPPEDCGGIWGYANLLDAVQDPRHPDHQELSDWAGTIDPDEFDVAEVNAIYERW